MFPYSSEQASASLLLLRLLEPHSLEPRLRMLHPVFVVGVIDCGCLIVYTTDKNTKLTTANNTQATNETHNIHNKQQTTGHGLARPPGWAAPGSNNKHTNRHTRCDGSSKCWPGWLADQLVSQLAGHWWLASHLVGQLASLLGHC